MAFLKVLMLAVVFLFGLIGAALPKHIKKKNRAWLSIGSVFSAGIFIGAGLIHLLGDAESTFESLNFNYPVAYLICGLSILVLLAIEKLAVASKKRLGPRLLFIILSLHSIIAGAALGLENTLISSIALFIAIIAHKSSAAFALGVQSIRQKDYWRRLSLFSGMTPLGIILGLLFSTFFEHALLAESIFDSAAAGTFLYIALMDVMPENIDGKKTKHKLAAAIIGFLVMAALALYL